VEEVNEKEGTQGERNIREKRAESVIWPGGIRGQIACSAIILSYILWAFVLIMIKSQGHHNCDWAFPAGAFFFVLTILILNFVVFFSTRGNKKHSEIWFTFLIMYSSFLLAFVLYISVAAMCWCSDPEAVTKTYVAFSLIFMGDTAIKGAMFNGLV